MSADHLKSVANKLVELCKANSALEALSTLYSEDAISEEMGPGPDGSDPKTSGIEGIRGKHAWWDENFEVHGVDIQGPFLHGDSQFAVIFEIDATMKATNDRWKGKEVAVYSLNADGKINREQFFGTPMG